MLLVQKYLENHSFGDLIRDHGVYGSLSKSGHKFSLNYDQLEAKESDPLSQECRGLILACEDGRALLPFAPNGRSPSLLLDISPGKTRILSYPMKRFFNFGQGSASEINWSDPTLQVLEKLDGTLCIVYYDPFTNHYCVATRSVSEADLLMDNGIFTFRTLFEKALFDTCGKSFDEYTDFLDKEITYCFELTTPYNRIVVNYPNNGITLLAARSILYDVDQYGIKCVSLDELDISNVNSFGVPHVRAYPLSSINDIINWVATLNPMDHEGVVILQGGNRIKIKNPSYCAYSRLRDTLGTSERNCLELILLQKEDDAIPFLPEEIVKNLLIIKDGLQKAISDHDLVYQTVLKECNLIKPGDKKTFAIAIQNSAKLLNGKLWTAPFFSMFDQKSNSMKDFIQKNRKDGSWGASFLDKILEISR